MGRGAVSEVIGGSSLELKVAGPSMLGIGCPDRHALPRITLSKMRRPRRVLPSRASGFVLRPKAAIRLSYSITSSARERIDGGMVKPSALAVLRLTTSSNVVGCCTGRSAGLAPLAIRST